MATCPKFYHKVAGLRGWAEGFGPLPLCTTHHPISPSLLGSQWAITASGGIAPSLAFNLGHRPGLQQPGAGDLCILGLLTSGRAAAYGLWWVLCHVVCVLKAHLCAEGQVRGDCSRPVRLHPELEAEVGFCMCLSLSLCSNCLFVWLTLAPYSVDSAQCVVSSRLHTANYRRP